MNFSQLLKVYKMSTELFLKSKLHFKCRDTTKPYLRSDIFRFPVSDEQVPWNVSYEGYTPPDYTAKVVEGKAWADSPNPSECNFNTENDGGIVRISYNGPYSFDADGRPLNPFGRTGLRGRGQYGRWGPNHAADAIVSRVFNGQLQFVAIERQDTGELAIPGGMLDKDENAKEAAIREFTEEALGGKPSGKLTKLWEEGKEIYRCYVDDPRNTDNAWGETTCFNFHDSTDLLTDVELKGGDDAKSANWTTVRKGLKLYASHDSLIWLFAKTHGIDLSD